MEIDLEFNLVLTMEFNRPPMPTIINLVYDLNMKITLNNGDEYTKFHQIN
jgi:hypothetical protein